MPKQCLCQNGGACKLDGTCDCGDFEGEFCQKAPTVSRQVNCTSYRHYGCLQLGKNELVFEITLAAYWIFEYECSFNISAVGSIDCLSWHGGILCC